jgi:hypothetical protein
VEKYKRYILSQKSRHEIKILKNHHFYNLPMRKKRKNSGHHPGLRSIASPLPGNISYNSFQHKKKKKKSFPFIPFNNFLLIKKTASGKYEVIMEYEKINNVHDS